MSDTVEVYLPKASRPVLLDCQDFCDVWQKNRWTLQSNGGLFANSGEFRNHNIAFIILRPTRPLVVDHINRNHTDNSTLEIVIAGVVAAVGIGWSYWHHKSPVS